MLYLCTQLLYHSQRRLLLLQGLRQVCLLYEYCTRIIQVCCRRLLLLIIVIIVVIIITAVRISSVSAESSENRREKKFKLVHVVVHFKIIPIRAAGQLYRSPREPRYSKHIYIYIHVGIYIYI